MDRVPAGAACRRPRVRRSMEIPDETAQGRCRTPSMNALRVHRPNRDRTDTMPARAEMLARATSFFPWADRARRHVARGPHTSGSILATSSGRRPQRRDKLEDMPRSGKLGPALGDSWFASAPGWEWVGAHGIGKKAVWLPGLRCSRCLRGPHRAPSGQARPPSGGRARVGMCACRLMDA
jgi:hypothetical protein